MVYGPIPPISGGNYGTIDPTQFGRTGSIHTNPDFASLFFAQTFTNNFDILFGDEERRDSSIFGGASLYNTIPNTASPLFGGLGGLTTPSDIGGQATLTSGISPYMELIARSNLIGKTVEAINPLTRETFTGKVDAVLVENGILLIDIAGTKVTPEYLVKVTE